MSATEARTCGARAVGGPCVLPRGHNMGKADVPDAHRAATSGFSATEAREALALVLRDHFVLPDDTETPLDDTDRRDADDVITALAERGFALAALPDDGREGLRAAVDESLRPYLELARIDAVTTDRIIAGVSSRLAGFHLAALPDDGREGLDVERLAAWFHDSEELCEHDYDPPSCVVKAESLSAALTPADKP